MKHQKIIALLLAVMILLGGLASVTAEENHIWQLGDTGDSVRWIQQRLIDLAYLDAKEASGVYDEATGEAVAWFQREHWLLETGMVDQMTWQLLEQETALAMKAEEGRYEEALTEEAVFDSYMMPAYAMGTSAPMAWENMPFNTEEYTHFDSNRFLGTDTAPLSTFAADVDTSSYARLRRRILSGEPIPADSVRVEEMLNYFHYDYDRPKAGDPFGVTVTCGPCPWNPETRLLQIGLQAAEITADQRPAHHLVFLIDTSGSMEGKDRLDLVKRAFQLLLEELTERDLVSIVTYASQDRVVLEGVRASEKTRIMEALADLEAGGATNGSAGLIRAYELAEKYRIEGGVNRILLATDGDLNVGVSSEGDLARLVSEKKQNGVSLTCLGFGFGNYKDNKMEALADYGDGNCWYIDTIHEARKALISESGGTFITVAKDVKIQLDFNPAYIRGYRLIGYEDRLMAAEDFSDDTKDGGEVGSGHRVTAVYEIVPADSEFDFEQAESRYRTGQEDKTEGNGEMLTLSVRAKEPEGDTSRLWEYPVSAELLEGNELNDNMKFAAAVIEIAMLLRDSEWKGTSSYADALALLRDCGSVTGDSYKEEFLYLVNLLERGQN